MSESVRDIRARTRARIDELDAKRDAEIRRLREKHARELEALRKEEKAHQEEMRRRIVEMEKKQAEQINQGMRELAEETKRLKDRLQNQLDEKARQLEAEIIRREKLLQSNIERMFREFDQRLRELLERITSQEEREVEYARTCINQAKRSLDQVMGSEIVREFQGDMIDVHRTAYNRLQGLIDQKLWPAVASSAMLLRSQCQSTERRAESDLQVWEYWNQMALEPIQSMLDQLEDAAVAAWSFNRGELSYVCAPYFWNEAPLQTIKNELEQLETPLLSTAPRCMLEEMKRIHLDSPRYAGQLEMALEQAENRVASFLLMAQLMDGVCSELPYLAPEWELTQEPALEEIENNGSMVFSRTDGSFGELQINVQTQQRQNGGLMMTIRYDGTKNQHVRRQELFSICSDLEQTLSGDAYGALQLGQPSLFVDGDLVCVNVPVMEQSGLHGTWLPDVAQTITGESGAAGRRNRQKGSVTGV
ncbi:MAG: hypothetical protein IKK08_03640 [Clostridia bacterium]|nr:hypothetical protein [Clostridia bacterium]